MCATCTWIFVPAWRKKPAQNRSQIRRRKHRRERDDAETGRSMMGVPKIVLGRLRRASNPGNHPGPDLLTAFAEHALAKRERLHVLEHLAQCSECREIVSLARPEIAEPQTSLKLFSRKSAALRSRVAPAKQFHGTLSIALNAQARAAVPAWRARAQRTPSADRGPGDFQDCWPSANARARS